MKRMFAAPALAFLLAASPAAATISDPLLQKLVDKGTLTQAEAEEIQKKSDALSGPLKGLSVGGTVFLDYSFGEKNGNNTHFNSFQVTRGYLNIREEIAPWLKVRMTPDLTLTDKDGNNVRLKFLFAEFLVPDAGPLTGTSVIAGLGITPFQDFEQTINIYRMQGGMFQERNNVVNISDVGLSLLGGFGGPLTKEEQERVGYPSRYEGRYGTYHLGVYNGGGYKAPENNRNKAVEGRITIRPLPAAFPGLQFTYSGIFGKGNTNKNNNWISHTAFVSCQMRYVVVTGQYVTSIGEQSGADQFSGRGYSFFGDLRLPFYDRVSVILRYDRWDPGVAFSTTTGVTPGSNFKHNTSIGGLGYRIYDSDYMVAAYERTHFDVPGANDDQKGQVVLQLKF